MDLEEDLYDEFGNFIGQTQQKTNGHSAISGQEDSMGGDESSDLMERDMRKASRGKMEEEDESGEEDNQSPVIEEEEELEEDGIGETRVVLNEDKRYYPEMEEVYPGAEILIEEEDEQAIEKPIVSMDREVSFYFMEKKPLVDTSYLLQISKNPSLVRTLAVVGGLHHGKTTFVDVAFEKYINSEEELGRNGGTQSSNVLKEVEKYTDHRHDEKARAISLQMSSVSVLLESSKGKNFVFNLIDTPGHPNFEDEVSCAIRLADGALLIVDVVEGCTMSTQRLIHCLIRENTSFVVVLSKIDRLPLELKLPPSDAYLKLRHVIEEINQVVLECPYLPADGLSLYSVSPTKGNVLFAAGEYRIVFSLETFGRIYEKKTPKVSAEFFAKAFWGDVYYQADKRKFETSPSKNFAKRSFVEFVLEPLYKIMGYSISFERNELEGFLSALGLALRAEDYKKDAKPFLRLVARELLGSTESMVDILVKKIPSADVSARKKITSLVSPVFGSVNRESYQGTPSDSLLAQIVKMVNLPDCKGFRACTRVLSGTLKKGQQVQVLDEKFHIGNLEERRSTRTVSKIFLWETRFFVEVDEAPAGSVVLLDGVDLTIEKTGTIVSADASPFVLSKIRHMAEPIVKVSVEPVIPSELPKLVEGLRSLVKSYPVLRSWVEESGEHVLLGTGELYMDSVLCDLRKMYSEIEIKVSDPVVSFCETVVDTSSTICKARSPNGECQLKMTAEPIDKGLPEDVADGFVNLLYDPPRKIERFFEERHEWDLLSARSVWAFGPEDSGPNLLMDYTLPMETNAGLLKEIKPHVIAGFKWACEQGPLCEEPIRGVKYKVIEAQIPEKAGSRGAGVVVPLSRRVCMSSFLMATPRLMEPNLKVEILTSSEALPGVHNILAKRRAHVIKETANPGTPFHIVLAIVPGLDSFGFETDLRCHTTGQAFCLQVFDHWQVIPSDPLDQNIQLKLLEPAAPYHLARDILVKTR